MSSIEGSTPAPRVIPKFSSFKPAVPVVKEEVKEVKEVKKERDEKKEDSGERKRRERDHRGHRRRSRSRDRDRDRDRKDRDRDGHHKHHVDRPRSRSRHHRKDSSRRPRHHHRSRSPLPIVTKRRSPSPEAWDAPANPFFVDTQGDAGNETYGTLHAYSVPAYHRGGRGRVVGLSPRITIDRDKWDGKNLALRDGNGRGGGDAPRLRSGFAKPDGQGVRRLRVKKEETGLVEAFARGLDFVPFSASTRKRKKRGDGEGEEGEEGEEEEDYEKNHYRSLEGLKKRSDEPEDQDLEYASDSQSDGDYIANQEWGDRTHMVEFMRKVETEPRNIDAWLAYVDHHDTIIHGAGRRKTAAEKTSTAEIKLDILSKALAKNPANERLLLKYMSVAGEIWSADKVLAKWKEVLHDGPPAFGLWTTYLNFRQTDFQSFTYPAGVACFTECLAQLRAAAYKTRPQSAERDKIEEITVYVLLRAALLMYDAGYCERAIGMFQGLLELNLFRAAEFALPQSSRDLAQLLGEMETWWDAEVPRVGEAAAKGWKAGTEGCSVPEPTVDAVMQVPLDPDDPFGSWTAAELEWQKRSTMPARTTDEIEEDDPYRVILFSDIAPFLVVFTRPASTDRLLEALLALFNLPPLYPQGSNSSAAKDPLLRNGYDSTDIDAWFWPDKHSQGDAATPRSWDGMEPEKTDLLGSSPFAFRVCGAPVGDECVFAPSGTWFDGLQGLRMAAARPEERAFVRHALRMLVFGLKHKDLALYCLAWTWVNFPEEAKSTAKALLGAFKTHLPLWSAYAQISWHASSPAAGRQVFTLALGMAASFSPDAARDALHLWHAWIWEELSLNNTPEALRLLLSIPSGTPQPDAAPSPAATLRARRHLESTEATLLAAGRATHAAAAHALRALLSHLSGAPLDDTLALFPPFLAALRARPSLPPALSELTHLRRARLAHLAATTQKPFRPSTLRTVLDDGLTAFPASTPLLALYAWNEARTKIENRLRTRLLAPATPAAALFAVWAELRMRQTPNGHAVRSLFERAVERWGACAVVWRLYAGWEKEQGEGGGGEGGKGKRAAAVWARSVRALPWRRDVALWGLVNLWGAEGHGGLGWEEVRRTVGIVFNEKELRCHDLTEMEDAVEAWVERREREERERIRGDGEGAGESGSGSGDEEMVDEW
ncbi:NRDE-2, necessary for RNA interference-domain-containing protein [Geopyxis carbonaria]|nr:NRDE-2, necessary for RNA interference-domain-containing protein [Geopyxis carbonaria]